MTMIDSDAVVREIEIAARPETIFAYFTDPDRMVMWKGTLAELDPRPGGRYRVNVTGREVARGEYLVIEPYERLVFSWGWEGEGHPIPPGSSQVEVTLTPRDRGTLLRLVHSQLPAVARPDHGTGWDHFLERLAIVASGGDPGADPWVVSAAA